MGGNRNMDELIKRKLDGLEIEPSQLTFNKVQKAYQLQKTGSKAGNKNLYWLFILFGVLLISGITYSIFNTNTDTEKLAQTTTNSFAPTSLTESNSNNSDNEGESTVTNKTSIKESNISTESNTSTDNTASNSLNSTEENSHSNAAINSDDASNTSVNANTANSASSASIYNKTKSNSESASANKQENNTKSVASKNTNDVSTSSGSSTATLAKNNSNSATTTDVANITSAAKQLKSRKTKSSSRSTKDISTDDLNAAASKNADNNSTDLELPQTILQSKSTLPTNEEETLVSDYLTLLWTKLSSTQKEQNLIPTNDSLARLDLFKDYYKKRITPYYFTLSSEIQLNSINQSITPNTDFNVKVDLPQFNSTSYNQKLAESVSSSTQLNFGGSFLLGFHYQNWGVESGIRFFGFENTTYLKHLPSAYYKSQFSSMIYDTLGNVYDSLYTTTSIRYPFVVNGDTVSPTKYLNTYRFLAIPLRFNYGFRFLKSKILVEPSIGVQVCLPMASSNLVYDKPYNFTYEKSTKQMKPFMQYDGALKVQYQISRSAGIYLRQGYSFGNQSMYKIAYPLKLSFNMLYTSVGISVNLRK